MNSANHELNIHEVRFKLVLSGSQTSLLRLNKPPINNIRVGDTITFYNSQKHYEQIIALVGGRSEFTSVYDLFHVINPTNFGYPPATTLNTAIEDMCAVYNPSTQERHGVLALHFDIINTIQ